MLSCANSSRRPERPQGYSFCQSRGQLKLFVERWDTVEAVGTRTSRLMLAPITAPRIGADRESRGSHRPYTDFSGLMCTTITFPVDIRTNYDLRSIWNLD
jgi:hypothetical protein